MSDRNVLVVLANPAPGQDAGFNRWYDRIHIPQVLAIPGFAAAQRFRLHAARLNDQAAPSPYQYMTVWEIDGDPAIAFKAHDEAFNAGQLNFTPAIDLSAGSAWTFQALGAPRH